MTPSKLGQYLLFKKHYLTSSSPIQVGVKGLGYSIAITVGASVMNAMLSIFKNHAREILLISCVLMSESNMAVSMLAKCG